MNINEIIQSWTRYLAKEIVLSRTSVDHGGHEQYRTQN